MLKKILCGFQEICQKFERHAKPLYRQKFHCYHESSYTKLGVEWVNIIQGLKEILIIQHVQPMLPLLNLGGSTQYIDFFLQKNINRSILLNTLKKKVNKASLRLGKIFQSLNYKLNIEHNQSSNRFDLIIIRK